MTMYNVYHTLMIFLQIISGAIFVFWLLSILRFRNRFMEILARFIYPFVRPFRRPAMWVAKRTGLPVDFSLWFSMLGLEVAGWLIGVLFKNLFFSRGIF